MQPTFDVSRAQILSFRRATGCLNERLPTGAPSVRRAAWAGLQDSMPRAALLSLHARVKHCKPCDWEHSSLVQMWGPRYNVYTISANDTAVFSLGRLPTDHKGRSRAKNTSEKIRMCLGDRTMPFGQVGHLLKTVPNNLRYAAPAGTVLLRWDGARQPIIRVVPAPSVEHLQARLELARRYLHIFGPAKPVSFARWAGVRGTEAQYVFQQLAKELTPVRTPVGDCWTLAEDEALLRAKPRPAEAVRLLPSGDAYFLAWDEDRTLLVPDVRHRVALWTTRVWPGALLIRGEIAGVWRRSALAISIRPWCRLARAERDSIEAEAQSLPISDKLKGITVRWN